MKKLLVLMMALILSLSLVGCGGDNNTDSTSSTPSQSSSESEEVEYSQEQQALTQEFLDMANAYNDVVDRVNATPEILENEELIEVMNELADELMKADEYFANPEILTPEVMEGLKKAIDATHEFITEAEAALDEIEGEE